ncbi:MAG TPA: GlsB/YeaQ/YmgE family stress response membrane protein [Gammaproteobacteria bacterium]|nr:GlsB/YeaQ/YmgE family stress response membrane protein [Gammaproteobacteria bacterium]
MDLTSLILFLIIGAIAGWLAGMVMKGRGFGLLGDIIVGIIGAVIGGYLLAIIGFVAWGLIGSLITAFIGAVVLLAIIRLIKRA